jgi:IS4 transposase
VDPETELHLGFLTNNFQLPALTVAQLYRCRWQVELFFRWLKQAVSPLWGKIEFYPPRT